MRKATLILAVTALAAAANAGAVELYASDDWDDGVVTYVTAPSYHTHYHAVDPVEVYSYSQVDVQVQTQEPPGEFDDLGLIELGAGYGGFYMPSLRESLLQAPRAHLALILDPVSVNLDISIAKDVAWGEVDPAGTCTSANGICGTGDLVQTSLGFAWRWNRNGHLHPTAGAGLELASLDPAVGDATFGFTAAVTAGLIFEYPLPYGALEAGLDTTAHVKLVAQDKYPLEDTLYLTFGGYVGYRF